MPFLPLHNPFFVLEVRRSRRSGASGHLTALGIGLGIMAAPVLWAVAHRILTGEVWFPGPGLMQVVHALFCMGVAVSAGQEIFNREVQRSTLEPLLMLPHPESRWLRLKLCHPLWWLLVYWLAALPLYVAVFLLDLAASGELAGPYFLALLLGIIALADVLAKAPEITSAAERGGERPDRDLLFVSMAFSTASLLLIHGRRLPWKPVGLFGFGVPSGLLLASLVAVFAVSAWRTATAAVNGLEAASDAARRARLAATLTCLTVAAGLYWAFLPRWVGVTLLLGAVLYAGHVAGIGPWGKQTPKRTLKTGSGTPWLRLPRDAARAEAELTTVTRRWDNAMLRRDLQAHLHNGSLFASVLNSFGNALLSALIYYLLWRYGSRWGINTTSILFFLIGSPMIGWMLGAGQSAQGRWMGERRSGTLPLLLLTPQSSSALLGGRIVAEAIASTARGAGTFLLTVTAAIWYSWRFWQPGFPLLPALLCWVAALWLARGGFTGVEPDDAHLARTARWLTWFNVAVPAVWIWLLMGGHLGSAPLAALASAASSAVCLIAAREWFRLRVRQFDAIRRSGEG